MPAIDQCESQVIRALQKAGWQIIDQPYPIRWEDGYVYADLRLQSTQPQPPMIVVEVKCFSDRRSVFDELYRSTGQYIFYRNALNAINDKSRLFLAVPSMIYANFLSKVLIHTTLNDAKINLVVVDLEKEAVTRWITL